MPRVQSVMQAVAHSQCRLVPIELDTPFGAMASSPPFKNENTWAGGLLSGICSPCLLSGRLMLPQG